jgi:hypothetical protein
VAHDLATPTDAPARVSTCVTHPADFARASRELSACTRLIKRTNRINHTEADILAEVVAFDHAEALEVARFSFDINQLNPAQSDGLACVSCAVSYLTVRIPHRPVGRSHTGSQIFVCSPACPGGAV